MTTPWKRSALRWLPTFAGFPLGGIVAGLIAGPVDGLVAALLAGALVVGAATAVLPVLLATRAPRSAS